MQSIKRMILVIFTCFLCVSGTVVTHAQTNTEALQNVQQQLDQQAKEKQSVQQGMDTIQQEMQSLNTYISENTNAMAKTQEKIAATNKLIEEKKEEIVTLEDKMLARKGVMKQRLVALQHDNNLSMVIRVLLEAKSLDDFIQRASAVSALFSADNDILGAQQEDLQKIEVDKKEIDSQQQSLQEDQKSLAKQQADLNVNLQKRQENLTSMQQKYSQIDQQMAASQQQKAGIEAQIKAAQDALRIQQEQAQRQAAAQQAAYQAAQATQATASAQPRTPTPTVQAGSGQELYVTATAYSWQDSGAVTRLGYNIQQNPNMKLIAVDPSVIPLGKKVWVEGYGVAVAGDTGGAIVGNRIDILMPSSAAANAYGRKTVKVVILD